MDKNNQPLPPTLTQHGANQFESLEMLKTGNAPKLFGAFLVIVFIVSIVLVMFMPWQQFSVFQSTIPGADTTKATDVEQSP